MRIVCNPFAWLKSAVLTLRPAFQEYELQLMTYRAFVESQQKSQVKRRRVHSSSDAITQEVRQRAGIVQTSLTHTARPFNNTAVVRMYQELPLIKRLLVIARV